MFNGYGQLGATARAIALAAVALGIASPADAQFGGLKKKLKAAAAPEQAKSDTAAAEPTGQAAGGTIVLTPDVLGQLMAGLRAGEAERQAATKADTPYGKHRRAVIAYDSAKTKCEQGQQTFYNRMAANEKLADKYDAVVKKMVDAQGRGDNAAYLAYNDSAMAMQDPACVVKEPKQPDDFYEMERATETRAEKAAVKASGFTGGEMSQVRERVEAVLVGAAPPGDLSVSEKSAVASRTPELKRLLGIQAQPPAQTAAAPVAAPAPAPPAASAPPAGSTELSACMSRNVQKHEAKLKALSQRGEAAGQAGNTAVLLAIADTIQQLQMAGCGAGR